jgi:hypothetical protein
MIIILNKETKEKTLIRDEKLDAIKNTGMTLCFILSGGVWLEFKIEDVSIDWNNSPFETFLDI